MSISIETLKETMAAIPGTVSIIASDDSEGCPMGLTVMSFTSLSAAPPLVLFCIDNSARSFAAIAENKHFSVNVLGRDQREIASVFASKRDDKWEKLNYERGETGLPLISGCIVNLECARQSLIPGGDHTIVVGRVLHCRRGSTFEPLLYHHRAFWQLQRLEESDATSNSLERAASLCET